MPRYLALYRMRDAAVLESDACRRRLARPTPASARMRPHLRDLSRWVCAVDGSWLLAVGLPAMPDAARQRGAMAGATLYRRLPVAVVRP